MSRNTGIAPEQALEPVPSSEPTSADYEAAIDALDTLQEVDEEVTLTMRAEERQKLIEAAFAEELPADEITIDHPAPILPPASTRIPTLKVLTIARPPSSRSTIPPPPLTLVETMPPSSRWRLHVTPALAQTSRDLLLAEDAKRRGLALKRRTQLWLVAGIWAMALSLLVVVLTLIVTNA